MAVPQDILILGAGVFGLSTAQALINRPLYKGSKITVVSPYYTCKPASGYNDATPASVDNTRIIRADYAKPMYSELAREALKLWQQDWASNGLYHHSGLLLTANAGSVQAEYVGSAMQYAKSVFGDAIQIKTTAEDISAAMGHARGTGDVGYLNTESGWANAEGGLRLLEERLRASGKITFVQGKAVDVSTEALRVAVLLDNGQTLKPDLTILATGAWTPSLVDMQGVAACTAQCMAYFELSQDEAKHLAGIPVHFNLSTGNFIFPPVKTEHGYEIKVAKHDFGYANPVKPSGGGTADANAISLPCTSAIPDADLTSLAEFFAVASNLPARKPIRTRLCHYFDTASGDFIVAPFRDVKGLFIATGGSGHAFKFLPVLGERIVDVLSGQDTEMKWTQMWAFPKATDGMVWCQDGSRSGRPGRILSDALNQ